MSSECQQGRRSRASFTQHQLTEMERIFASQRYHYGYSKFNATIMSKNYC